MELYYLIYTSSPARLLSDDDLEDLLRVAREANTRFEVTGMLVCLPDSYIQLIEGPKEHIQQLYHNIQQDQRHLRVTTLKEGFISSRFFPDWAMAFKRSVTTQEALDVVSLQNDKVLRLFDIMDR